MTLFANLLANGVSLGFIYALLSLGLVVIFKATGVFNFAHGSVLLLGGYVVAETHQAVGFPGAVALGIVAAAACSVLIERLVAVAGTTDAAALGTLTIGIDIVLVALLTEQIGQNLLSFGDPWGNRTLALGSVVVPQARVAAMIVSLVLVGAFFLAFKFSGWGVATRATAEDAEAAALMGIRRRRVSVTAWLVAGALVTVAAVFLAASPNQGLSSTANLTALNALPAAIIGGLDSTGGAVVGGLLVGVVQSLAAGYNDQLSFLGSPLGDVAAYVLMFLVLLIRPSGLFGTKAVARV